MDVIYFSQRGNRHNKSLMIFRGSISHISLFNIRVKRYIRDGNSSSRDYLNRVNKVVL